MTFSVTSGANRLVEATIPHMIPLIINSTPVFLSIEFQLIMVKTVQKSIWLLIRPTESESAALETAHLEIPGKKKLLIIGFLFYYFSVNVKVLMLAAYTSGETQISNLV